MIDAIVLDSSPLGLLVHKPGLPQADECREWLRKHAAGGIQFVIPDIVIYEIRRELIRVGQRRSLAQLAVLTANPSVRVLEIVGSDLTLAAQLWADARKQGRPTADVHAIDIDVILAAQVLGSGLDLATTIVATSNVKHLAPLVPADEWRNIN